MVRVTPANAGIYDQRIRIEINTATVADREAKNGAQSEIWTESYFDVWAAYTADPSRPGGAEYNANEKRNVEDRATWRVRFDGQTSLIDPAIYRIRDLDSGKIWNIQRAYDPTGKRAEIHIESNSII